MFLIQNLYTLGGFVVGEGSRIATGPLKAILDRVANQTLQRIGASLPRGEPVQIPVTLTDPRFQLEPDLNDKRIRVTVEVNGTQEELVLGYETFFSDIVNAHGEMKLVKGLGGRSAHRGGP